MVERVVYSQARRGALGVVAPASLPRVGKTKSKTRPKPVPNTAFREWSGVEGLSSGNIQLPSPHRIICSALRQDGPSKHNSAHASGTGALRPDHRVQSGAEGAPSGAG